MAKQKTLSKLNWSEFIERSVVVGIYFWIFLLPWQIRYFIKIATLNGAYWEAGTFSLYASEVILIAVVLLKFFAWLLQEKKEADNLPRVNFASSLPYALAGFVLFVAASAFWSVLPSLSVYYAIKIIAAWLMFIVIINSKVSLSQIMTVLIAAGIIQGYMAIVQFNAQIINANKWLGIAMQDARNLGVSVVDTGLRRWLRSYGSLPHPNILGGFLVISLVAAIRQFLQSKMQLLQGDSSKVRFYNLATLISLIFIGSGIALSFSRAAWLASILVWIVFLVWVLKQRKMWLMAEWGKIFAAFVLSVLVWTVVYPQPFLTRLTGQGKLEQLSWQERAASLSKGEQVIGSNWYSGVGVGAYTYYLYQQDNSKPAWFYQPIHNSYLMILAEVGIWGVLFLLWVVYAVVLSIGTVTAAALIGAMLLLLVFDHWWWTTAFGWYLIFMILAIIWLDKKNKFAPANNK